MAESEGSEGDVVGYTERKCEVFILENKRLGQKY